MSSDWRGYIKEQFELVKEYPAVMRCASWECSNRPLGVNVHNRGNELESPTYACADHIREDGEWFVKE
jgi:hypothetical protein